MSLFADAVLGGEFPAISALPWATDHTTARMRALSLLLSEPDRGAVKEMINNGSAQQRDQLSKNSMEKATHYKWLLGKGEHYSVWLHQYMPPERFAKTFSYAASVHNHRYGFSSVVLKGGLHVTEFLLEGDRPRVSTHRSVLAGEGMTLSADDIHRIDRVDPETFSLLIQGPAERHYSTSYNLSTGEARDIPDMDMVLPVMVTQLPD